jgi:hypothetical protein
LRQRLSLADVIAVDHAFGLGFATKFVADVGPWAYPDDESEASIGVKRYVQSNPDKARASKFDESTEESKTAYLLVSCSAQTKVETGSDTEVTGQGCCCSSSKDNSCHPWYPPCVSLPPMCHSSSNVPFSKVIELCMGFPTKTY